ncbi:MAG: HEPN domain-containing protein [Chloroflexi bacterium]|nr:HEPN domain-containing protein [Chloroflexota bacterium]
MADLKDNYQLYMENADDMLEVAQVNFENGFYRSACNRAYYGIFYAASALVYSKGKSYGKHSAVIAAFRQYFIRTGEFDKKWSDDYRVIMENRHIADYELQDELTKDDALMAIEKSKEFVKEVKLWLQKHDLF